MPPPPPLPPPPPPPPLKENSQCTVATDNTPSSLCFHRMEINVSKVYEEIEKFAIIENGQRRKKDLQSHTQEDMTTAFFYSLYSHVQPILQHGPLCGLVALAMIDSMISTNDDERSDLGAKVDIDPDIILAEAKKSGYSNQGEMFSAFHMLQLVQKFYPMCSAWLLDTEGASAAKEMTDHLIDGNSILIPYDADFNHGPALRNGHAAHWGLLHGIAILLVSPKSSPNSNLDKFHEFIYQEKQNMLLSDSEDTSKKSETVTTGSETGTRTGTGTRLSDNNNVVILEHISTTQKSKEVLKGLVSENKNQLCVYAIGHQGKSGHVGLWGLDDLILSNQNLREISPKIMDTQGEEPLILNNISNSLRSQVILIMKREQRP